MPFQILRTAKLTSKNAIRGSAKHNYREQETKNADRTKTKQNQHIGARSASDLFERFEKRLEEAAKVEKSGKLRKNAVLGIEYLITTSPEWARENDRKTQDQYFNEAMQWLTEKHGKENVLAASIHRDESTPHLVVYVVPCDKSGKLNCRSFLGGADKLAEMQDSFHASVSSRFGLARGQRGSPAEHIPIREYYKRVNAPLPQVTIKIPEVREATLAEVALEAVGIETERSRRQDARDQAIKERNAQIKERNEAIFAKAKQFELEKRNQDSLKRDLSHSRQQVKEMAAKLRETPLGSVLERFGATQDPKDKNNYRTEQGRITVDGQKFFNHDLNKGGGGAIDLVMHLHNCDYKQALSTLSNTFGSDTAAAMIASQSSTIVEDAEKSAKPIRSVLPEDVQSNWPGVKKWLVQNRGLSEEVLDKARAQGILRADERGNVLFVNSDSNGGEIRGKGINFKGYRGKRGLFILNHKGDEKSVLVVESGTDAIAFASSHPMEFGKIVSTGGDFGKATIEQLKELKNQGYRIVVGTDNDDSGEEKFLKLKKELGLTHAERLMPKGRDWQEDRKAANQPTVADRDVQAHHVRQHRQV